MSTKSPSTVNRELMIRKFEQMRDAYENNLTSEDKASLAEWDKDKVTGDGVYGTSDWPGWAKYLNSQIAFIDIQAKRHVYHNKKPISFSLRWEVFKRDDFRCKHCGTRDHLRADHILPESKGGPTTLENLQTLCRTCNSKKGVKVG